MTTGWQETNVEESCPCGAGSATGAPGRADPKEGRPVTRRRGSECRQRGLLGVVLFAMLVNDGLSQNAGPPRAGVGEEVRQKVACLSYLSGTSSISLGEDATSWRAARVNAPILQGDRLRTDGGARLEIEMTGHNLLGLGGETDAAVLGLDGGGQLGVLTGRAVLRLERLSEGEVFEVATPLAAVTIGAPGLYGIEVVAAHGVQGTVTVTVRRGAAVVNTEKSEMSVAAGQSLSIDRRGVTRRPSNSPGERALEDWLDRRGNQFQGLRSLAHVDADVIGARQLDENGSWENRPDFGYCWSPSATGEASEPYRNGRWIWRQIWGWTWVSEEAWGWAPYHYGRWVKQGARWYWAPPPPSTRGLSYAPALVAFLGGGSDSADPVPFHGGDVVGWFPLAPRDPFYPWWLGRLDVHLTRVTEFVYLNRAAVTLVPRSVFVSGESVSGKLVADPVITAEALACPVLRLPLPVFPTRSSLGGSSRPAGRVWARPGRAAAARLLARRKPPELPPSFLSTLEAVRAGGGRPLAPAAAASLWAAERRKPVLEIRLVGAQRQALPQPPAGPTRAFTLTPVPPRPQ